MGIKRPLIILGSTVSAVAAVLSYHPAASGSAAAPATAPESTTDVLSPTSTSTPTLTHQKRDVRFSDDLVRSSGSDCHDSLAIVYSRRR